MCGNNLATTVETYEAVGGFPRASIDTTNDDTVYERKVLDEYGPNAVMIDRRMRVATSMRRLRTTGYIGYSSYYRHPERRGDRGPADIRSSAPALGH